MSNVVSLQLCNFEPLNHDEMMLVDGGVSRNFVASVGGVFLAFGAVSFIAGVAIGMKTGGIAGPAAVALTVGGLVAAAAGALLLFVSRRM